MNDFHSNRITTSKASEIDKRAIRRHPLPVPSEIRRGKCAIFALKADKTLFKSPASSAQGRIRIQKRLVYIRCKQQVAGTRQSILREKYG